MLPYAHNISSTFGVLVEIHATQGKTKVYKSKKCLQKKSEHEIDSQSSKIYDETLNKKSLTNTMQKSIDIEQQILSLLPKSAKTEESRNIPGIWRKTDGSCCPIHETWKNHQVCPLTAHWSTLISPKSAISMSESAK